MGSRAAWLFRIIPGVVLVAAVCCIAIADEEPPQAAGERQPPTLRRVRVFNGSNFKVKSVQVKVTQPPPPAGEEKDLGKLIQDVHAHRAASADAGQDGFLLVLPPGMPALTAGGASEIEIGIVMVVEGMDRVLPPYTIGVGSGGFEIADVLLCIESHPNADTWNVTTCTFSQSDETQPLVQHPSAPVPVAMTAVP